MKWNAGMAVVKAVDFRNLMIYMMLLPAYHEWILVLRSYGMLIRDHAHEFIFL